MNEQDKITRRQVVAGLGATMAAAVVSPAIAATEGLRKDPSGSAKITDPTAIYPKPPFKFQPQPWPGLQSKMDPFLIVEKPVIRDQAG